MEAIEAQNQNVADHQAYNVYIDTYGNYGNWMDCKTGINRLTWLPLNLIEGRVLNLSYSTFPVLVSINHISKGVYTK